MSAVWESANWTRQTGNRQFGMLPLTLPLCVEVSRVRALSPAWTGCPARETLISSTHLFLPHDLPPTKKSSTIQS
jgi:hypothetical protein